MDTVTIFAITACVLCGAMVYVVLSVRHYGDKQTFADKLLKAQMEVDASKKKLLGYTKYTSFLDAGKQALAVQLKPPLVKTTRDYVHIEKVSKETFKLKADVTMIVKYSVEFSFALDLSDSGLELIDAANGIGMKLSRPTLMGEPIVKPQSHQMISNTDLPDEKSVLADIHQKFAILARRYGTAMSTEESVRTSCKTKALEYLRDFLAKQSGVQHVPAIFADYK